MNKYHYWIDAVKAICMILVYYVHCQDFSGIHFTFDHGIISAVYVNAFFVISGYLLFGKQLSSPIIDEDRNNYISNDWRKGINNILFRIAIPMVLFSTLLYFPKQIIIMEPVGLSSFVLQTLGGGTYWFTSSLCVAEIVIFILLLSRKRSVFFYLFITLSLSFGAILLTSRYDIFNEPRQPWSYMSGIISLGLLSLGGLYCKYEQFADIFFRNRVILLIGIILSCIPVYIFPDLFDFSVSSHQINICGYFWCFILSISLFAICKGLPQIQLLSFLGKNSLCLYFLSGVTPRISDVIFKRLNLQSDILTFSLELLCSLLLSIIIILVINKYFSIIYDLRKIHCKND